MFFAVTDGRTVLPLESAMDYKRAFGPARRWRSASTTGSRETRTSTTTPTPVVWEATPPTPGSTVS